MAGLYIHVPFCHAKCWYCDFYSLAGDRRTKEWQEALLEEWQLRRHEITEPFATMYVGGGTPSNLAPQSLAHIINTLRTESMEEITVEVNPEDVTPQLVRTLADCGVNRVSMGVQSMIDTELAAVGRRHTAQRAAEAVATIRDNGIANISLDLIYGLPGQTLESWQQSLASILALKPQHLSAYSLSYEPGTRLTARLMAGKLTEPPQELSAAMYTELCDTLREHGFKHYEISNFALPGKESRHNSGYWDFTPYLGLGPSAHSYNGIRRYNPSSLKEYIANRGNVTVTETENDNERLNDYMMVRLRTAAGLNPEESGKLFGAAAKTHILNTAAPHLASKAMEQTPQGNLRIAEQAWIVSDGIMSDFMLVD